MTTEPELGIYYEGGAFDRHWLAPRGLGITEAMKQRVGKLYKTREGARRALVAKLDAARRAEHEARNA